MSLYKDLPDNYGKNKSVNSLRFIAGAEQII